jgi:hypothetical protein
MRIVLRPEYGFGGSSSACRRCCDLCCQIRKLFIVPASNLSATWPLLSRPRCTSWPFLNNLSGAKIEMDVRNNQKDTLKQKDTIKDENFIDNKKNNDQKLTRCTGAAPTALPAKGRMVIRRPSMAGGTEVSSDSRDSRRNSSGSRGDSYRIGVRDRGFDLGRRDKESIETRTGVLSLDECSASESERVRVGLT